MIVIHGGTVLTSDGLEQVDVRIDGDRVSEIGRIARHGGTEIIDATGMIVGPGLVDLHVHFRDPGETWKEDLESGSRAAAAGGFTAVVAMPNTIPALDTVEAVRDVVSRSKELGMVDVVAAGAITVGRHGEKLTDIESLHGAGVRLFSDDGDSLADGGLMRKAMAETAALEGAIIAQHAEDRSLTVGGHMHEGDRSHQLGMAGWSTDSETLVVVRDLRLAAETGASLHIQHVSSSTTVALVERAKEVGVAVTSEVTPHHLSLSEDDMRFPDPNLKMYPPLRAESDRLALAAALRSGSIDAVATDHAPHSRAEKAVAFDRAPRGVIGLETALSITMETLGGDFENVFDRMSIRPAQIGGLRRHGNPLQPGAPANLVVIDPDARWSVAGFNSKSANSPFNGRAMQGRAVMTVHEGRVFQPGSIRE